MECYMEIPIMKNQDINFNTWNLDLNFSWQYRPGSLISVVCKIN